ncbi:hypothetical protein L484_011364 [Morus notabilis]|uniref:Uncharacterized protein n=1 Tax=Morus notabilis TaxID=981085 RepID=W9SIT8_9ROSA|nr:hypothetical protein L484_011364 [Morus notabilis]
MDQGNQQLHNATNGKLSELTQVSQTNAALKTSVDLVQTVVINLLNHNVKAGTASQQSPVKEKQQEASSEEEESSEGKFESGDEEEDTLEKSSEKKEEAPQSQ